MKTKKGFTLMEMIISMAVLVIMSTALAGAFSSGFSTFGSSRELQRNLENAQYALNTIEKFLRTSTVLSGDGTAGNPLVFYEYSSGRCFRYRINAGSLEAGWYPSPNPSNPPVCASGSFPAYSSVTTGHVAGGFSVVQSSPSTTPKRMGRVTVNLSVKESATATMESRIQATASLRDYSYVGF
ncbi:MAG: prepilin-type N-terminal cleavage/methylation domain-containing protein [Candidatus Moranbacteria bacterium]|jgi:prepilin-type N-terminal cleavage/methylation domain-containing protein|nr:prepilin-type N-terminal cleavage/methylation domain-containing protein [Candidatus Moranbacteria bacterium]